MSAFVRDMAAFLALRIALPPAARIVVAVSGGPDSSALLVALCLAADAGLVARPVGVAHFHHGLRGADADADAAFAAKTAATRARLPCIVSLGAVPQKSGQSPNDAARNARYDFLIEAAQELGADTIATAHTLDDQAETVLGRVLRGTGLAGLGGIPAMRVLEGGITIIRPLLSQRRSDVEAFCEAEKIDARHDPSNDKVRYTRSRLRRIMPALAFQFNPRLAESISQLAVQAAQDNDLLQSLAGDLWQQAVVAQSEGHVQLDLAVLRTAHPALRSRVLLTAIRAAVADKANAEAATSGFVAALDRMIFDGTRQIDLPGNLQAMINGADLTLERTAARAQFAPEPFAVDLSVPGKAVLSALGLEIAARMKLSTESSIRVRHSLIIDIAYNGSDSVEAPFLVRSAASGDRIAPLGMYGRTRAVFDLLAEAGVPVDERTSHPLVVDARTHEILWIVGLAQSESTRVTPETSHVIRLSAEWKTEHL